MGNKIMLLSLIALSAVFSIIGNIFGKQWVLGNKRYLFICAIAIWVFSAIFYLYALKYGKMGVASVAWDGATSLLIILAGYFLFKEGLTPLQIFAIIVIFFGEFLLLK